MIDQIPTRMVMEAMRSHQSAMRGGDDTVSYTQSGEIVIPLEVQQRFPGLAEAALAAIQQSGADPSRFVVGSPDGSYNPQTGAQEFFLTGLLDWASSNRFGQSLATGLGSAALARLTGASPQQSLAVGAGTGLGYFAGDALSGVFGRKPAPGAPPAPAPEPRAPSTTLGEAFKGFTGSLTRPGLTGAALGGLAGYALAPSGPRLPRANLDPNAPSPISDMPAPQPIQYIPNSEQANVSATLPTNLPVAPLTPRAAGVNYLSQIRDRYSGETSFQNINESGLTFSRALNDMNNQQRRSGFGNLMFM